MKLHILKRNHKAFAAWTVPHLYIVFVIQILECLEYFRILICSEKGVQNIHFVHSKKHFSRIIISLKSADCWDTLQGISREKEEWTVVGCELSTVSKSYFCWGCDLKIDCPEKVTETLFVASFSVLNMEEMLSDQSVIEVFPASNDCVQSCNQKLH